MPISKRFRLILTAVYFCSAYAMGMKILFGLSTIAPFIVTGILVVGTAIALAVVKRAARHEGAKTHSVEDRPSLIGVIKTTVSSLVALFAVVGAFQISATAGVSVIMLVIFGFMIGMVLLFISARVESQARSELAAKA